MIILAVVLEIVSVVCLRMRVRHVQIVSSACGLLLMPTFFHIDCLVV